MWILRMMLVSVCAAVVSMAFGASAATAEEPTPVEVMVEDGGHCPAVVFQVHEPHGGCEFTMHTDVQTPVVLYNHVEEPGEEHIISACDYEFEASLGEDGHGYLYHQQISGVNCGIAACDEAEPSHENLPWEFQIREFRGLEILRMTFCLRPGTGDPEDEGTTGTACTIDVAIADAGDHNYVLAANESPCINLGGAIEFSGGWFVEETGFEIEHPTT